MTESQASVMALESPHILKVCKMIPENTDLGDGGHDPPSIFKGPEAFRTREHC